MSFHMLGFWTRHSRPSVYKAEKLVLCLCLAKSPNIVEECCFSAPRIMIHGCFASTTTPFRPDISPNCFSNLRCEPLPHL